MPTESRGEQEGNPKARPSSADARDLPAGSNQLAAVLDSLPERKSNLSFSKFLWSRNFENSKLGFQKWLNGTTLLTRMTPSDLPELPSTTRIPGTRWSERLTIVARGPSGWTPHTGRIGAGVGPQIAIGCRTARNPAPIRSAPRQPLSSITKGLETLIFVGPALCAGDFDVRHRNTDHCSEKQQPTHFFAPHAWLPEHAHKRQLTLGLVGHQLWRVNVMVAPKTNIRKPNTDNAKSKIEVQRGAAGAYRCSKSIGIG